MKKGLEPLKSYLWVEKSWTIKIECLIKVGHLIKMDDKNTMGSEDIFISENHIVMVFLGVNS